MPTSSVADVPKSARAAPASPLVSPPPVPKNQFFTPTTVIAIVSALGIAAYLVTRYLLHLPWHQCRWILIAVLVIGGTPLVFDLTRKAVKGNFGSDLLAGISIITSVVLGEYLAGAIVVLMLSGGTALEEHATRRASSVLSALAKECPASRTANKMAKSWMLTFPRFKLVSGWWFFPMRSAPRTA
jgi:cation transport ATPase